MFTATRSASDERRTRDGARAPRRWTWTSPRSTPVDPDLADLVARHGLPLVVLDIAGRAPPVPRTAGGLPDRRRALRRERARASGPDRGDRGRRRLFRGRARQRTRRAHCSAAPIRPGCSTPRRSTHPHEVLAAYNAGVRRFVVDGPTDIEKFVGYPRRSAPARPAPPGGRRRAAPTLSPAASAPKTPCAWCATRPSLGVRIAGFSLSVPADAVTGDYVAQHRPVRGAHGRHRGHHRHPVRHARSRRRTSPAAPPAGRANAANWPAPSARSSLPATSHVAVTASASRAVTADCITVIGGTVERDVDPLVASDCIDDGAEVVVIGADDADRLAVALPLLPQLRREQAPRPAQRSARCTDPGHRRADQPNPSARREPWRRGTRGGFPRVPRRFRVSALASASRRPR